MRRGRKKGSRDGGKWAEDDISEVVVAMSAPVDTRCHIGQNSGWVMCTHGASLKCWLEIRSFNRILPVAEEHANELTDARPRSISDWTVVRASVHRNS